MLFNIIDFSAEQPLSFKTQQTGI